MSRRIVKVQRPISSTEPDPYCLIYDRTRRHRFHAPLSSPTGKALVRMLGDRLKAYFVARVDRMGAIHIEDDAPSQDW